LGRLETTYYQKTPYCKPPGFSHRRRYHKTIFYLNPTIPYCTTYPQTPFSTTDIAEKGNEIEGDYMNMLERIREEGKLKGELLGEQRGKLEKALETARNMKNLGLSMEVIVKSVGLSEEELRENGIL
jgi:hypothetical protein